MAVPDTETPTPRGYAAAFDTYWRAGWKGVLPIPARAKTPPPAGWTGRGAPWPSYPDVHTWAGDHDGANLALRLPENVIGLDVDAYDGKPGAATLARITLQHGPLPATWRTTSRDDNVSGIRLFRAPTGLAWPGVAGPGIEIIQATHRYAMAWPSTHPDTGATYRWINPQGHPVVGDVPNLDDLPHLPAAWVDHLTRGRQDDGAPLPRAGDTQTRTWLASLTEEPACPALAYTVSRRTVELSAPGAASRHDVMRDAVMRVLMLTTEGHTGALGALRTLHGAFLRSVAGDRTDHEANAEWSRALAGAAARAALTPRPDVDPCTDPMHGLIAPAPAAASTAQEDDPPPTGDDGAPDPQTEPDLIYGVPADAYRAAVAQDALRLHIAADARALHLEQRTPPAPPFDAGLLVDVLARPPEPAYRIEGLIPADASTLVVAQRKAGKTTLTLNIARALLTGSDLLGRFPVLPVQGKVALLNYEVSGALAARWAAEHGVPDDRLYLVNLRGRRNPLAHEADTQRLAAQLRAHDVETVIVDPFGRAYTGTSQNDAGEVQQYLVSLDRFAREQCGATDLILTAHAGWNGDRTRGSSALEDWADTLIYLSSDTTDNDDEDAPRSTYLRAVGRDVEIDEDLLAYDELTRTLTLTGVGGRTKARASRRSASLKTAVLIFVQDNPGCSGHEIEAGVEGRRDYVRDAKRQLLADRTIVEKPRQGRGGGVSYWLATTETEPRPTSPNLAPGELPNLAPPPYRGGGVRGEEEERGTGRCSRCGQKLSIARASRGATLCAGCGPDA